MRRWLLWIVLAACTVLPPLAHGSVQTYIPTGGYALDTSAETQLSVLDTTFTVTSTAEGYFLLVNLVSSNNNNADCTLRVRLHNVAVAIADQSSTVPLKANTSNITVQVPYLTTGAVFGLGAQTLQVFVTKTCGGAFSFSDQSYLAVFNSQVPGGAVVSLGLSGSPQTGAMQTFATGTAGTDFAVTSSANVHTWNLPSASATARGAVSTAAQTLAGVKTFSSGIISPRSGVAQTTQIGSAAGATQIGAVSIGDSSSANGVDAVCVGINCIADATGAIGIGESLGHSGAYGVGVGDLFTISGAHGIALGANSSAGADGIALGYGAVVTGSGNVVIGSSHSTATNLFLGDNTSVATPQQVMITATAGLGTNIQAGDMLIRGPRSTGNKSGGVLRFQRCVAGASGSTANSCIDNWLMKPDGSFLPNSLGQDIALADFPVDDLFLDDLFSSDDSVAQGHIWWDGSAYSIDAENTTAGKRIRLRSGIIVDKGVRITPATAQAITAAATAITIPTGGTGYVELTSDANYTLSAAPTIADGTKGDVVIVNDADSGSDCVTLQDQGTLPSSNLRLVSATRQLCARDSIGLLFDGSDWVELWFSNVL